MPEGSARIVPTPRINNSAEEWLAEVLRRAGASGTITENLAELYPPTGRRGRPYRPDPVRLYLAWYSTRLLGRLTDDQAALVLSNRYGVPVSNLDRGRRELRRFAEALRDAPWTALSVPQPLFDLPAGIDRLQRNARVDSLRANRATANVLLRRLRWLCKSEMRPPLMDSEARMRELERRALTDSAVGAALRKWEAKTAGSGEDLLTECIARYELVTFG